MALDRISDLDPGTPSYSDDTLFEVAVPDAGSPTGYSTFSARKGDVLEGLASLSIAQTWTAQQLWAYDDAGAYPASMTKGWTITSDFPNDGGARVDMWNLDEAAAADRFAWIYKTGASVAVQMAQWLGDATFCEFDLSDPTDVNAIVLFGKLAGGEGYIGTVGAYDFTIYTNNIARVTYNGSTGAAAFASAISCSATGSQLSDQIYDHDVVSTAQLDKTNNTTLATVTGLSLSLVAGKTYYIEGWLSVTAGASGGLKAALVASGGLTATSCRIGAVAFNGATIVANTTVTSLGSNIVANTAVITDVYVKGSIVVNAAGTINVQAAQNASNGTTTSVFAGSTFCARRVN